MLYFAVYIRSFTIFVYIRYCYIIITNHSNYLPANKGRGFLFLAELSTYGRHSHYSGLWRSGMIT